MTVRLGLLVLVLVLGGCQSTDPLGATLAYLKGLVSGVDASAGAPPDKPRRPGGRPPHFVELAPVVRDTLRLDSTYTGSLRSRRVVEIHSQEEGRITAIPFFEGDRVRAGDVLFELDDALLRVSLDKAIAVRKEAQTNLVRLGRLRDSRMVPEDEYLRAATAVEVVRAEEALLRTRLGYTRIEAPFPGVVAARLTEPGNVVSKHEHVLTVLDPSALVIDLEVSEMLLPDVTVGQRVEVRIDALGDREFPGAVLRVHPRLDPRTRQGRVEVELRPVPDAARPGQFARVRFTIEARDRMVAPFAALRRDRDGEFVYVLADDRRVHRATVRGGRRFADRVEILEGLEAGARVVVRGFLGLSDGLRVAPAGAPARDAS